MSLPPLRGALAAALALAIATLAHCSSDAPTTPPSTGVIGAGGGALASSDYAIEILVPPGALTEDVTFTITAVNAPGSGSLAPAYTIDPAGQTFASPVVVSYAEAAVTGETFHDATDYRVSAFDSNAWTPLANPSVDTLANTIEGTTTVLSANPYSVIIPSASACVNLTETCAAGDAGCTPPTCDPVLPPGKCAAYPGAVAETCTATSTGITVSCCYPTGEPICFTQSEPSGCETPCTQLPGSTAQSCVPDVGPPLNNGSNGGLAQSTCCFAAGAPVCVASHVSGTPAPRCATSSASACAAYPGTSVSSCTDVSDGTEAVCCLPVGTLPGKLPPPEPPIDGGTIVATDSGSDASGQADANGGADAAPDAGADAAGSPDTGVDANSDAGTDASDAAGD